MFKKPFAVGTVHKVSGADRKKLRRALEARLGLTETQAEAILPSKSGDLESIKLAAPSRVVIYMLDKAPLIVDVSGKMDLVPTVFAIWQAPDALPKVHVKHPLVTQFLMGGADLMLPGVDIPQEGLPAFAEGDLVAVAVHGNPLPMAVGYSCISSQAAGNNKSGKGKLVEVVQVYGDHLWSDLGNKLSPNAGFRPDVVDVSGTQEPDPDGGMGQSEQQLVSQLGAEHENDQPDGDPDRKEDPSSSGQVASDIVVEDMDTLLAAALMQSLHVTVKDKELPLNSTVLWSQHMIPNRPAGATLDVKKSKHKKLSKFLQHYSKAGLLKTKEDKHSNEVVLVSINRSHQLYTSYVPTSGGAVGSANGIAVHEQESSGALVVEEMLKPTRETKAIFEQLGLSPDRLYLPADAAEVPFQYARLAELQGSSNDAAEILLDARLCDALYKGVINKGEAYPTTVAKAKLAQCFTGRLQATVRLSRGAEHIIKKGSAPSVHVSVEKRQGNKRITKIVGVEDFLIDPSAVAAECQRKFACSSTTHDLPGKNQGMEVVIQGNVADEVVEHLVQAYGIPKSFFLLKKAA